MSRKPRFPWKLVLLLLLAGAATVAKELHDHSKSLEKDLAALRTKSDRMESELDRLYPVRIQRDGLERDLAARDAEVAKLTADLAAARADLARAREERDLYLSEWLQASRRLEDALSALAARTPSDRE